MTDVQVFEKQGKNKYVKVWTIITNDNYKNWSTKGSREATSMSVEKAKDIAKSVFETIDKKKDKSYVINYLYGDFWRASKPFNVGDAMKFPNETDKDYNTNTDIYNYVYGIQILEVPKRNKAMKV